MTAGGQPGFRGFANWVQKSFRVAKRRGKCSREDGGRCLVNLHITPFVDRQAIR